MRSAVITAATALILLIAVGAVAIEASYAGMASRTWERAPRHVELHPDESVTFRFLARGGTGYSIGDRPVAVVHLEPVTGDAPLPPGVESWPEPGQVVISPALMDDVAAVEQRYGEVVGTIGREGLASLGERLIYARPFPGTTSAEHFWEGSGFGDVNYAVTPGDLWDNKPSSTLHLLLILFALIPACSLLVVGVRLEQGKRRERAAVLETLGATPRQIMVRDTRETIPPMVLGTVAGGALAAAMTWRDTPLPGVGFTVRHEDMAESRVALAVALITGFTLIAVTVVALSYPGRLHSGTTVRGRAPKYPGPAALVAVTVIGGTATMAVRAAVTGSDMVAVWIVAGAVGACLLTPSLVGWLVGQVAIAGYAWAGRRGHPTGIIATRQISATIGHSARLASSIALLIILVTQGIVWASLGTQHGVEAERLYRTLDARAASMVVPLGPGADARFNAVHAALRGLDTMLVLGRSSDGSGIPDRAELRVTAETLTRHGVGKAGHLADLSATSRLTVEALTVGTVDLKTVPSLTLDDPTDPGIASAHLIILSPDDTPLALDAVAGAAYRAAGPGWKVQVPGAEWREAARQETHQTRWIGWFGAIGVTILLSTLWLAARDEIRRSALGTAPLGALTARPTVIAGVAAMRVGLATAIGCVVGGISAVLFSQPLVALGIGISPPYRTIAMLCGVSVGIGVVVWAVAARTGIRAAHTWRPGRDTT